MSLLLWNMAEEDNLREGTNVPSKCTLCQSVAKDEVELSEHYKENHPAVFFACYHCAKTCVTLYAVWLTETFPFTRMKFRKLLRALLQLVLIIPSGKRSWFDKTPFYWRPWNKFPLRFVDGAMNFFSSFHSKMKTKIFNKCRFQYELSIASTFVSM